MTAAEFILALVRVVAVLGPVVLTAWLLTRTLTVEGTAVRLLCLIVVAVSVLLVGTEALGLVKAISTGALCALFAACAIGAWLGTGRPRPALRIGSLAAVTTDSVRELPWATAAAVLLVSTLWLVQVTNVLGGGMLSFDTLWYHMPFATQFAQTGSVTAIQFTQADPMVAYFPANSELLHGVGIVLMHNDFFSPFLNVGWMAVALLASWCIGRPWRVERGTLIAGCLVLALPILSITQPGDAFSDTPGLAMLTAATALIVNARGRETFLLPAALALGFAIGTKYTFIVPVIVLAVGAALTAGDSRRARVALLMAAGVLVTGGWWYLRALIADGTPLGLRLHLGPLMLPGPSSPVSDPQQTAVISRIFHSSLWSSRFAPGFHYALGPIWPAVILIALGAVVAALYRMPDPRVRLIAIAAIGAAVAYLFLPAGAAILRKSQLDFQVNIRYATPALLLAFVLIPIRQAVRGGRPAPVELFLLLIIVLTQFAAPLWPRQTARHVLVLVATAIVGAAVLAVRQRSRRLSRGAILGALAAAALATGAGAFVVQRHYFNRRYLVPSAAQSPLSALYRWAQGVSNARIAVYGSVEQYPFYGARDTNRVTYLGRHLADGGFAPIESCALWRRTLAMGGYRYVVLTPGPTRPVPMQCAAEVPGATIVMRPAFAYVVFRLTHPLARSLSCSTGATSS